MNPGPVEEVGKATGSFIDALKREPLSLALVVMNLALLVFFYTILSAVAKQRETEVALMYRDKKEIQDILSKCIIPDKHSSTDPTVDKHSSVGIDPLSEVTIPQ